MKIQVTFKTPDAVEDAVNDQIFPRDRDEDDEDGDNEDEDMIAALKEEVLGKLEKWVRYGEYVTIEFDLKAGTAKVLEQS